MSEDLPPEEIQEKEIVEEQVTIEKKPLEEMRATWQPKTLLGKQVKENIITNIDQILDKGIPILEPEIVELLLPDLESDLLMIGQAKGKFGGGQRRVFKQTQKKTAEGNKPHFATCAVVGNKNGYVGIGYGKSKETVPARDKATRNAKLNIFRIRRGVGSWEDSATDPHSVPFAVLGKCGGVRIKLMPAPKGTGLVIEKECAKILKLAGIQDVWSNNEGSTTKLNLIFACINALKQLSKTKIQPKHVEALHISEGTAK